ncbi:MAG TPA: S41 family peptidase [Salinivirgaceae bacterium]|nr:S41 family peptidase [Salinivirgaceae bacterium]
MRKLLIILIVVIVSQSCEKILFEKDLASTNPYDNFDYLWDEVDRKYSYFELKNIDWNDIKTTYRAKLFDGMSEDSLFNVLKAMLFELRDDHTNLISPFNIAIYYVELQSPPNIFARTIQDYYLKDNVYYTGPFIHAFLANNRVGYISYSSFMNSFSDEQLDFILNRYKDTDGLILDLRMNGGGSLFIVPQILGRFVETNTTVCYFITRNGRNHNDFSDKESFVITPHDGIRYKKPVMVLIDRGSYSATTHFALATKALPNMVLVGDTTGGGGGLPNGGQLPNGWTYRFSIGQALDLEGKNYAEDGVPPDIVAQFDWSDLTKDEIIDRAIEEIIAVDN